MKVPFVVCFRLVPLTPSWTPESYYLGFDFGELLFLLFSYFSLPGLTCAYPTTTWASLLNKAWGQVGTETTDPHHHRSLIKATGLYQSYSEDA